MSSLCLSKVIPVIELAPSPEGVEVGVISVFHTLAQYVKALLLPSSGLARNWESYLQLGPFFYVLKLLMFPLFFFFFSGRLVYCCGFGGWIVKNTNMVFPLDWWVWDCEYQPILWDWLYESPLAMCFPCLWFQFFHLQNKEISFA